MGNEDWETPEYFFKRCEAAWGPFGLDAAADEENSKCEIFYNKEQDSLSINKWTDAHGDVWLNPPYTKIKNWVDKALVQSVLGARIVMLLPNDTDTKWFHKLMNCAEIYITQGRVKFIDPEGSGRTSPRQGHIVVVIHPHIIGINKRTGIAGTISAKE